jgi:hypothetical protein
MTTLTLTPRDGWLVPIEPDSKTKNPVKAKIRAA